MENTTTVDETKVSIEEKNVDYDEIKVELSRIRELLFDRWLELRQFEKMGGFNVKEVRHWYKDYIIDDIEQLLSSYSRK